jgi:hypothetical protein
MYPDKTEDNVPVSKLEEKKYEENIFCILKVTEDRSRIRSWIRSRIY